MTAVDDRAVLLQLETETYFDLDPVGTRIWLAIADGATLREAAASIAETYDAPMGRIEGDLQGLVHRLEESGLVVLER